MQPSEPPLIPCTSEPLAWILNRANTEQFNHFILHMKIKCPSLKSVRYGSVEGRMERREASRKKMCSCPHQICCPSSNMTATGAGSRARAASPPSSTTRVLFQSSWSSSAQGRAEAGGMGEVGIGGAIGRMHKAECVQISEGGNVQVSSCGVAELRSWGSFNFQMLYVQHMCLMVESVASRWVS
jgi:hypothetical protein